jgi:hypothetical protein
LIRRRWLVNIYVRSLLIGSIGTVLAYALNLVMKYNVSADWKYWGLTLVAFVVGSYVGLKITESRRKKSSE